MEDNVIADDMVVIEGKLNGLANKVKEKYPVLSEFLTGLANKMEIVDLQLYDGNYVENDIQHLIDHQKFGV